MGPEWLHSRSPAKQFVCLAQPHAGSSSRYPAGARRAVGQYEDPGSQRQPEASELCEQPNPQETKAAWVGQSVMDRLS